MVGRLGARLPGRYLFHIPRNLRYVVSNKSVFIFIPKQIGVKNDPIWSNLTISWFFRWVVQQPPTRNSSKPMHRSPISIRGCLGSTGTARSRFGAGPQHPPPPRFVGEGGRHVGIDVGQPLQLVYWQVVGWMTSSNENGVVGSWHGNDLNLIFPFGNARKAWWMVDVTWKFSVEDWRRLPRSVSTRCSSNISNVMPFVEMFDLLRVSFVSLPPCPMFFLKLSIIPSR